MSMRKSTLDCRRRITGAGKSMRRRIPSKPQSGRAKKSKTVLVTGIRASMRESLEVKRESQAVVDVITSEDVGKFPDKNVAEALQRVSGVTISREFGEGERVSIRGTAPEPQSHPAERPRIATADWFVLDQLAATRSFNYLMLPTEVIGQTEVYKGSQADIEEGGIGGTVNVKTRNPLDLPCDDASPPRCRARTPSSPTRPIRRWARCSAGRTRPRRSASWSPRIYQERNLRRDGIEFLGYSDRVDRRPGRGDGRRAGPARLGAVRAGARAHRRQLRPAVPALRRARHQSHRPVLQARGRQLQPQLHGVVLQHVRRGRAAHEHDGRERHAGRRHASRSSATGFGVVYDAILRDAETETQSIDLDMNFDVERRRDPARQDSVTPKRKARPARSRSGKRRRAPASPGTSATACRKSISRTSPIRPIRTRCRCSAGLRTTSSSTKTKSSTSTATPNSKSRWVRSTSIKVGSEVHRPRTRREHHLRPDARTC